MAVSDREDTLPSCVSVASEGHVVSFRMKYALYHSPAISSVEEHDAAVIPKMLKKSSLMRERSSGAWGGEVREDGPKTVCNKHEFEMR